MDNEDFRIFAGFLGVTSFKPSASSRQFFRVPNQLRELNERAYQAQEVSIGPYQLPPLGLQYKLHYLKHLFEIYRPSGDEKYSNFGIEYYRIVDELLQINNDEVADKSEFVKTLVLGCSFVFEFIRRYADKEFNGDNEPIFATPLKLRSILRDILLFEAQFPFKMLQHLYDLTTEGNQVQKPALKTMVAELFNDQLPNFGHIPLVDPDSHPEVHLLGLVHRNLRPCCSASAPPPAGQVNIQMQNMAGGQVNGPAQNMATHKNYDLRSIRSAAELRELCGVKFEKVETKEGCSLFNIKFDSEKGILKIPTIFVEDVTEALLRNMMVYEYLDRAAGMCYVTHYMILMKCLIRSSKDVKLLCDCKIISGMANNHKAIAQFFLSFGVNSIDSCHDFCYQPLMDQVEKFCQRKRNKVKAKVGGWFEALGRDYFNSPWTIISFLAGFMLLALTLTQTTYTILPYYRKNNN